MMRLLTLLLKMVDKEAAGWKQELNVRQGLQMRRSLRTYHLIPSWRALGCSSKDLWGNSLSPFPPTGEKIDAHRQHFLSHLSHLSHSLERHALSRRHRWRRCIPFSRPAARVLRAAIASLPLPKVGPGSSVRVSKRALRRSCVLRTKFEMFGAHRQKSPSVGSAGLISLF